MKKMWLLFLFLLVPQLVLAGDMNDVKKRVRIALNEDSLQTTPMWTDGDLTTLINDAQWLVEAFTEDHEKETTYTMVEGTLRYGLPSDFWALEGFYVYKDVAGTSPQWKTVRPIQHKRIRDFSAVVSPDMPKQIEGVNIWEDSLTIDGMAITGEKLVMQYLAISPEMDSDTNDVRVAQPLETLMQFYVRSICYDKAGTRQSDATASMNFFVQGVERLTRILKERRGTDITISREGEEPLTETIP